MGIVITNNAYIAAKERLGFKKNTTERMALRALMDGINTYETSGQLFKYLEKRQEQNGQQNIVYKIYGENVYAFANNTDLYGERSIILVTVFMVPKELRNHVKSAIKRLEAA